MNAKKSLTCLLLSLLMSSAATAQITAPAVNAGNLAKPVDIPQYRDTVFPIGPGLITPPPGLIQVFDPGKAKAGPLTVGGSSIFSLRALCRSFVGTKLKEEISAATNAAEVKYTAYLAIKNVFSVHKMLDDRWMLNATEKNLLSEIRYEISQWHPDFAEVAEQFCEAEELKNISRLSPEQAEYTRHALQFIREVLRTSELGPH